jgi:hypothetical protein
MAASPGFVWWSSLFFGSYLLWQHYTGAKSGVAEQNF